jgi:hypothetical protein
MSIVSVSNSHGRDRLKLGYLHPSYTWKVYGQPIPAPRLTQATARHPTIPRGYYAFKHAVRSGLLDTYPGEGMFPRNILSHGWPFRFPGEWDGAIAILEYTLTMAKTKRGTCRHGDPDNIVKAIADALFSDDRHVLPRCLGLTCGSVEPQVEITVVLCV